LYLLFEPQVLFGLFDDFWATEIFFSDWVI